ncbi:hypothetical protein Ccrd_021075 [Cynara cardunculus var. scolymus]|uniref:Uncharacterized protein n=1 Tax=Cynara cardunculus var. scolymus TaxID=59895 RepID=A0A118K009_CYNCS|nr:hypothetical protein Ccrd_021075 [Cynara cardunculus var. scolymus]
MVALLYFVEGMHVNIRWRGSGIGDLVYIQFRPEISSSQGTSIYRRKQRLNSKDCNKAFALRLGHYLASITHLKHVESDKEAILLKRENVEWKL